MYIHIHFLFITCIFNLFQSTRAQISVLIREIEITINFTDLEIYVYIYFIIRIIIELFLTNK